MLGDISPHSLTEGWLVAWTPAHLSSRYYTLAAHPCNTSDCKTGEGRVDDKAYLLGPGTQGQRTSKTTAPSPSPEPIPDNQMVVIITVVSVLLFLFVTSILLCFAFGQHWRLRRMGTYGVQGA